VGDVKVFDEVVVNGDVCFNGSFGVFRSFSSEAAVSTESFVAFGYKRQKVWYNISGVCDLIKGDEWCAWHSASHDA